MHVPGSGRPDSAHRGPALAHVSALAAGVGVREIVERFPPRLFERGDTLVEVPSPGVPRRPPCLAYVIEGLVRGAWHRSALSPETRATAIVAGDGRWVGADAFKFGENLFRYDAVVPTTACVVPLGWVRDEAPRGVLVDALQSVSLDWCTTASVLSLGGETLERRTLLLLYDMRRLHPRPEIEVRQQDVADLLGVARQTLQPVLKGLERAGLVSLGYGAITIGDAETLLSALRRPE